MIGTGLGAQQHMQQRQLLPCSAAVISIPAAAAPATIRSLTAVLLALFAVGWCHLQVFA